MLFLFKWQGINSQGKKVIGESTAVNQQALEIELMKKEITPLCIRKVRFPMLSQLSSRIKPKQLTAISSQLSLLMQAEIPLTRALSILEKSNTQEQLSQLLHDIKKQIEDGESLSKALSRYPQYFDATYRALILAGEQSGTLKQQLQHLTDYQEHVLSLKSKISKALFYPITVLIIAFLITGGLLTFVVPQFQSIFANFDAKLPTLTQWVINLSNYLRHIGLWILPSGLVISVLTIKFIKHSNTLTHLLHHMLLKLPFFGLLIKTHSLARWTYIVATTIAAGIPLIAAINTANQSIKNHSIRNAMNTIQNQIKGGQPCYHALENTHLFSLQMIAMITTGEESGSLSIMLKKIAGIYQSQLDNTLDHLSKLLEPVIMVLLSIITGGLIIAMYLPVLQIGHVI